MGQRRRRHTPEQIIRKLREAERTLTAPQIIFPFSGFPLLLFRPLEIADERRDVVVRDLRDRLAKEAAPLDAVSIAEAVAVRPLAVGHDPVADAGPGPRDPFRVTLVTHQD
ncbi:MAG: hypothetical protein H0W31_02580 [Actinobacteria bacterium]|nr:hypothetical protein [Actinomycetota bacterium]